VIPGDAVFRTRDDVRYRIVAPEAVVVRQSGPEVLVLNGVGARVLESVAAGQPFAKVVAALAEEYEVPAPTLERDVVSFLDELVASGVIENARVTHGE
jgi:Coenzyme PQQ synthesis protein D (PqqD)